MRYWELLKQQIPIWKMTHNSKSRTKKFSRRKFLIGTSVTIGSLATTGLSSLEARSNWQKKASNRVLHIIGHSHIDAAWLWPWRDASNVVLNTFRSALDRMKETPEFRYVHSSAMHYRWVERADPKMFEE